MKIRHLILLLLKAAGGEISSKTKIQKQVYFLSLIFNKDFGFKAHYYGPYSPIVEQSIGELIGAGFVKMNSEYFGFDKENDFEIKRYDFSLTESGAKFAIILEKENQPEYIEIKNFINALQQAGNPNYISLSIAAKEYYILKKAGKAMTTDQLRSKAKDLCWDVKEEDAQKAVEILKKLDFVKEHSYI